MIVNVSIKEDVLFSQLRGLESEECPVLQKSYIVPEIMSTETSLECL